MTNSRMLAVLAGASLVFVACGTTGTSGTTSKGTIKIGVELPESGKEASNGLPTLNGVKYYVQTHSTIKGFTIEVENLDDAVNGVHDPSKGAQNMQTLVADAKVLGVVGPFNSGVAKAEIPVANQASLVMVSPANTNECLTQDFPAPECTFKPADLRPTGNNNYFRVAATDNRQGPALADYAVKTLGLKNVCVADDGETYGQGIANNFKKELVAKGAALADYKDYTDIKNTNDFKPFWAKCVQAHADGVYFGGTDSNKVCIARQQMKAAGLNVPFMGGDGIVTSQCITDAADNVDNMYGTVAAVDATQVGSAKSVITGFKTAFTAASDFGAYTIPAYDCAGVILDAISRAIDAANGNMPTRAQVRTALAATKAFGGALGTFGFDANGDTTLPVITIYKVGAAPGLTGSTPKDWVYADQVTFS